MYQAINDRRITDSSFRQQILYTVNQVESIYWGLVGAYEDVQAKQRALDQSTKLSDDTHKQLEIGTMAPLDVVQADSTVATDKQALTASQNTLNYQQQIIKQAIARNLNDPTLSTAPVIPTDRISSRSASGREPAGRGSGAGRIPEPAGTGTGGADAAQRRDHAEGRAEPVASGAGCLRLLWIERAGWVAEPELRSTFKPGSHIHREQFRRVVTALC